MIFRLRADLDAACPQALFRRTRRNVSNRRIVSVMAACLIVMPASAGEPDESGFGGTGHRDETNGVNIFDRPEMPDRIERVETPDRPEFSDAPELPALPSDAAAPPGDVGNPDAPSAVSAPSPEKD